MIIVNPKQPDKWKPLLRLQLIFAFLFFAFLPIGGVVIAGLGTSALLPFAAVYGGVLLSVQHWMVNWKCPACHKPFLRKNGDGFALIHRTKCGACGMSRTDR